MRELCTPSSQRIQFSAHFDELVRVYSRWMYGDECGNRLINLLQRESSEILKVLPCQSGKTQYHTILIIHTLYAQTHIGSHSSRLSWHLIHELWDGTWDSLETFALLNGNARPFFFFQKNTRGMTPRITPNEQRSLPMPTEDNSKALGNA